MGESLSIWECKHGSGHVLGIVQKNSSGESSLLLYRNAVDQNAEKPAEVDIIAVIHSADEIKCEICGRVRTWAPNQAAFERLMAHYENNLAGSSKRFNQNIQSDG